VLKEKRRYFQSSYKPKNGVASDSLRQRFLFCNFVCESLFIPVIQFGNGVIASVLGRCNKKIRISSVLKKSGISVFVTYVESLLVVSPFFIF